MIGHMILFSKSMENKSNIFPIINGILLPKLFWPTVRKKCSSDREKLLKLEAEGQEFAIFLRSLEQFIHLVRTIFGNRMLFLLVPGDVSYLIN